MVKVSPRHDIINLAVPHRSMSHAVDQGSSEAVVTRWLEQLLSHFGIHELKDSSDQQLIELMAGCGSDHIFDFQRAVSQDSTLLYALKQRIIRLAGARLDTTFMSMAPDVINLEDTEAIALSIESQQLKGVRYQEEVYRLVESFEPRHRLQAFCLGETLKERGTAYLITQSISNEPSNGPSSDSFSVWVNVRALPRRSYRNHLASNANIMDLAC